MPTTCSVYGLGLHVDQPIAGLAGLPPASEIDVRVSLGPPPEEPDFANGTAEDCYVSADLDEHGVSALRVARLPGSKRFRFDYGDGTVVVVDSQGSNVWASSAPNATLEDTATYILGPILGFVLRLRGITCLHASAVAIGERAIALVGPSGAGKSSTAAAFARRGHSVLADDLVALRVDANSYTVQPAYPRLRLWPESVEATTNPRARPGMSPAAAAPKGGRTLPLYPPPP